MEEGLTLSKRDERRVEVLNRVLAGQLRAAEAALLLGVGERQAYRLVGAYRRDGPRAVVHGNRGRTPARAIEVEVREAVVALATGRYAGFNHSHLTEMLQEREGLQLSRATVQRVLAAAGVSSPRRRRRRSKHRARRERYPQEGMLLQVDASHHAWLQERSPKLALLGAIDDATGKVVAALFQQLENAEGYLRLLRQVVRQAGIPQALYTDKHSVFWPTASETLEEQLAGRRSATQFGRAMQELGVELIAAHSPQAKGRVERLWDTLQDRLIAELRLANVCTIEQANAFLPSFLRRFNAKLAVAPLQEGSAYRPRLSSAEVDRILCFKHERVVSNDNCVRLGQGVFQIRPGPNQRGYAKARVVVHETVDHHFSVFYRGEELPSKLIPLRKLLSPKPASRLPSRAPAPPQPLQLDLKPLPWKPPPDHPWRSAPRLTKSVSNKLT
jgi:transposase